MHLFVRTIFLAACSLVENLSGSPTNLTELDTEDFLNVYFLPSTLVLESDLIGDGSILLENATINRNADVDSALNTMSYHRTMINKYLCRNYIAKEILSEVGGDDDDDDVKSDRLGIAARTNSPINRKFFKDSPIDQNELLDDEGSDNYKKWLAKSSIFEDIFKHHNSDDDLGMSTQDQSSSASSNVQLYESGDITGYAVQAGPAGSGDSKEKQASQLYDQYVPPWAPPSNVPVSVQTHAHNHHKYNEYGAGLPTLDYGGHSAIDAFGHGYGHIPDHHLHVDHGHGHHHHHHEIHGHDDEKGLALKDLFDLALTALAFLAFGMFILNLILTCFTVQTPTVMMMMGESEGNDSYKRVKREMNPPTLEADYLNQLTYSVVSSMDALASMQTSPGKQDGCLQLSLCKNNKYARQLPREQQIWVPIWSFGLSWISGKIRGKSVAMLEHLRAIVLGMGKAQCERIYSQCTKQT